MAEGRKAADQTKGAFKGVGDASESARKNVNSFIDELGGNKQSSSGIHPDAKKTGDEAAKGIGAAAGKVEGAVDKNKKSS
ncbi:uncharacterized protein LTR77_009885 [Saxophila tyrrhenica]|uniref:Uncharacterized protein n=1 Tax=Saxophila tyrrhenica TaxID=1690608 RepID=A0AAV9NXQ4_9PEZI|nr:hypothetical protein LTR77_009885 [Saxophila tyrrhenica]